MALWRLWERSAGKIQFLKSDVRGDLSRELTVSRCRRCDGTIQEADLAEDLLVDEELLLSGRPS